MVSPLFYYQLGLLALVWLFVMLHITESRRAAQRTLQGRPFNIWLSFVHCCLRENKTQLAGGDKDVVGHRIGPLCQGAPHLCHGPGRVSAPAGRRSDGYPLRTHGDATVDACVAVLFGGAVDE
jgi:hypothetical protein